MQSLTCNDFSLSHTLESGQFFRYELDNGWHYIISRGRVFCIRQQGDRLGFEGASPLFIRRFFSLDKDYPAVVRKLRKDRALCPAVEKYPGLHIIRQDPWECTVSFLCSQLSSIGKIRKNVETIARNFGRPVVFRGRTFFAFPRPGEINDSALLKKCGTGFRTGYIIEANRLVSSRWLSGLGKLPYAEAKARLMELPGIGEKVADCILLFSLGFGEAFPVDVWVERALRETFFKNTRIGQGNMAQWARNRWGAYAGYAQQYLYHWRRLRK